MSGTQSLSDITDERAVSLTFFSNANPALFFTSASPVVVLTAHVLSELRCMIDLPSVMSKAHSLSDIAEDRVRPERLPKHADPAVLFYEFVTVSLLTWHQH